MFSSAGFASSVSPSLIAVSFLTAGFASRVPPSLIAGSFSSLS
ncbi:hypothetical protein HanXRQr2_Chr17g0810891 [Helianthus annuus]|uniref:Uncharacterized protein n=1 Tax=Helianthus annuus TaxID=4232 RepID=A0A9K3DIW5_HELAN|nr:hypothetical protein HanXRQr2_Chr17g0810891 [Helianthus annuus]KAJ0813829.1 hypothetical protein HanPSC8_Chr17g0778201 [Helianthus annuus]